MKKYTKSAFTLVELIVVITILAILATVAFISLSGKTQDARNSKVVSDLRTIVTSIEVALTEDKITMWNVSDNTWTWSNNLDDDANTFASWTVLDDADNYKIWKINFLGLRVNSSDFNYTDGELTRDYIAATAVNGNDNAFYQVAWETKNADESYTAVIKGNYLQLGTGDVGGLIAVSDNSGTWVINKASLASDSHLY